MLSPVTEQRRLSSRVKSPPDRDVLSQKGEVEEFSRPLPPRSVCLWAFWPVHYSGLSIYCAAPAPTFRLRPFA